MATKSQDLITHFLGQNLKVLQINKKLMGTVKRNTYEMEFANSFRRTPFPKNLLAHWQLYLFPVMRKRVTVDRRGSREMWGLGLTLPCPPWWWCGKGWPNRIYPLDYHNMTLQLCQGPLFSIYPFSFCHVFDECFRNFYTLDTIFLSNAYNCQYVSIWYVELSTFTPIRAKWAVE